MPESGKNRGLSGGQGGVVPESSIVSIRQTAEAFSPHTGAAASDASGSDHEPTRARDSSVGPRSSKKTAWLYIAATAFAISQNDTQVGGGL